MFGRHFWRTSDKILPPRLDCRKYLIFPQQIWLELSKEEHVLLSLSQLCHQFNNCEGPRWPSGKVSAPELEGSRFETRFHRISAAYAVPLYVKSYVRAKLPPAGVMRKFGGSASSGIVLVI
ncbi:hypothetical protein AVEN_43950-1 [Araneus ventricosus]|uniref:Uncharacterized protein n=1 Tax=Araneus ventricosus TaxID=182803 RepID=A0A4Y2JGR2_ARAVE|nr:hypothetical protein AVEN_32719-1 [Araneus ventricosus]GBM89154.1 hypothetical protein AVEN_43950-1 [Araneus ventricosus]